MTWRKYKIPPWNNINRLKRRLKIIKKYNPELYKRMSKASTFKELLSV